MVGQNRHLDAEQGSSNGGAEQGLEARVVGVGHHRDAAGEELGAGGVDEQVVAAVRGAGVEGEPVVVARDLAVLHLRLGHRGALVDVVQGRCVVLVGLAAGEVVQERHLADPAGAFADGRVEQAPVDAEPETFEQGLEHGLVFVGDPIAQVDEVRAAGRHGTVVLGHVAEVGGLEVGDVGQRTGRSAHR